MKYEGKVYRPWIEADSILIQTTLGCTHNKCTFCDMFREKRFRIREIEEIFKDIDDARRTFRHIESIFLIDGNVLALENRVSFENSWKNHLHLSGMFKNFPLCRVE